SPKFEGVHNSARWRSAVPSSNGAEFAVRFFQSTTTATGTGDCMSTRRCISAVGERFKSALIGGFFFAFGCVDLGASPAEGLRLRGDTEYCSHALTHNHDHATTE